MAIYTYSKHGNQSQDIEKVNYNMLSMLYFTSVLWLFCIMLITSLHSLSFRSVAISILTSKAKWKRGMIENVAYNISCTLIFNLESSSIAAILDSSKATSFFMNGPRTLGLAVADCRLVLTDVLQFQRDYFIPTFLMFLWTTLTPWNKRGFPVFMNPAHHFRQLFPGMFPSCLPWIQ